MNFISVASYGSCVLIRAIFSALKLKYILIRDYDFFESFRACLLRIFYFGEFINPLNVLSFHSYIENTKNSVDMIITDCLLGLIQYLINSCWWVNGLSWKKWQFLSWSRNTLLFWNPKIHHCVYKKLIGLYPEPVNSSPHLNILFLWPILILSTSPHRLFLVSKFYPLLKELVIGL
jgi:hypothetical protein